MGYYGIKSKILIVVLVLISTECFADDKWFLTVGGWSYHTSARGFKFDGERTRNEVHNPFGIEYEVDQKDYTLSMEWITFVNSYYQQSSAINFSYLRKTSYGNFGFKLGVVTGYEEKRYDFDNRKITLNPDSNKYMFLPLPVYSIKYRSLKFEISFAPKIDKAPASSGAYMVVVKTLL